MDQTKVVCKICNSVTICSRQTFAKHHLKKTHSLTSKEYYDLFKPMEEGYCKVCGKEVSFRNIKEGYAKYCSNICSINDKELSKKKAKTRLEKEKETHNGLTFFQTEIYKKLAKLTKLKKYGNENYCNKTKIKITKELRYGDGAFCNPNKIKETKLKRYGDANYVNLEKMRQTLSERYGIDNFSKTQLFREKMEQIRHWIPKKLLSNYSIYRKKVKEYTNKHRKELYGKWTGLDFYTNEKLVSTLEWKDKNKSISVSRNELQPTIDHKIPIAYGYIHNIDPEIIGGIENLCICSRKNNITKNSQFNNKFWKILTEKEA